MDIVRGDPSGGPGARSALPVVCVWVCVPVSDAAALAPPRSVRRWATDRGVGRLNRGRRCAAIMSRGRKVQSQSVRCHGRPLRPAIDGLQAPNQWSGFKALRASVAGIVAGQEQAQATSSEGLQKRGAPSNLHRPTRWGGGRRAGSAWVGLAESTPMSSTSVGPLRAPAAQRPNVRSHVFRARRSGADDSARGHSRETRTVGLFARPSAIVPTRTAAWRPQQRGGRTGAAKKAKVAALIGLGSGSIQPPLIVVLGPPTQSPVDGGRTAAGWAAPSKMTPSTTHEGYGGAAVLGHGGRWIEAAWADSGNILRPANDHQGVAAQRGARNGAPLDRFIALLSTRQSTLLLLHVPPFNQSVSQFSQRGSTCHVAYLLLHTRKSALLYSCH